MNISKSLNTLAHQNIGNLFKAARKYHDIQQTTLASMLEITQGTVSKIESGIMKPDLVSWFSFLDIFKIKDPYCFFYDGIEFDDSVFIDLKLKPSHLASSFDFSKDKYVCSIEKLRPVYDYLMQHHEYYLLLYLRDSKIKREMFYILNHPVTSELFEDLVLFIEEILKDKKALDCLNQQFNRKLPVIN